MRAGEPGDVAAKPVTRKGKTCRGGDSLNLKKGFPGRGLTPLKEKPAETGGAVTKAPELFGRAKGVEGLRRNERRTLNTFNFTVQIRKG